MISDDYLPFTKENDYQHRVFVEMVDFFNIENRMVLAYILIGGWEGGGGRMLTKYAMASFITEKTMIF